MKLKSRIVKFLKRYFAMGRTSNNMRIWQVNEDYLSWHKEYPEVIQYLKKKHPYKWYDDELESLFFYIYEYMLENKIPVKIEHTERMDTSVISIGDRYRYYSRNDTSDKLFWLMYLYGVYRYRRIMHY